METRTVTARATNGTLVKLVIPTDIPTNERAEELRALYKAHVQHPDGGHWKGEALAIVPAGIADDVAEAMDFHGSVVDMRSTLMPEAEAIMEREGLRFSNLSLSDNIKNWKVPKGHVWIYSRGYWAHGF